MNNVTKGLYGVNFLINMFIFGVNIFYFQINSSVINETNLINTLLLSRNDDAYYTPIWSRTDSSGLSLKTTPFSNVEHLWDKEMTTKPPDIGHGTTTLSFLFNNGIVVAVDSRA